MSAWKKIAVALAAAAAAGVGTALGELARDSIKSRWSPPPAAPPAPEPTPTKRRKARR